MSESAARGAAARRLANMTDVAARAGVSTMTVSNVINRPEMVAEPTQLKVRKAMRDLNYRNNLVARSLRLTEPRQIGYSLSSHSDPSSQYMGEFLHDLALACQARGRNLTLLAEKADEDNLDAYEDLYYGRSVAGFVIANMATDDVRPQELTNRTIPFVSYGQTAAGPDVPWSWVDGDATAGVEMAVDHVVSAGHTQLAYVGNDNDDVVTHERLTGYRAACARHGLDRSLGGSRIIATQADIPSGAAAAHQLLTSTSPPTAIVCADDALAAGTVLAVRDLALIPGRDVAVTGFDDSPLTSFGATGITSIRQHSEEIATTLIQLLIDAPAAPQHVRIKPELVVRSSTGPRP